MFSVADATLVPVLRTLCFAARALVVVDGCWTVAARPRCVVGCVDSCCVALRDVTVRGVVVVEVSCGATVGRTDRAMVVIDGRVAPNAADVQARITNAKDIRFKRNPFYYSLYFIIK